MADEPIPIGAGRGVGYWGRFYVLLSIASIIASIGLWRDSGAVVIAAMLLAPLMEPILGIASTLVQGYVDRVFRLLLATLLAALVVVGLGSLTMFLFQVPRGLGLPSEILARTDPGLGDLLVALAAGMAGSYVQMRRKEAGLLPGVAIGVSLVPPLAAAGILLYYGEAELAWGAVLLFLTNLAAIVLTACAVFAALGMRPASRLRHARARVLSGLAVSVAVVLLIASHLAIRTAHFLREARDEQAVLEVVEAWAGATPIWIRHIDVEDDEVLVDIVFDVPMERASEAVAPDDLVNQELSFDDLARRLQERLGRAVDVKAKGQVRYSGEWPAGSESRQGAP
jgi:uncharacterized hydrophobic protein (TIGR00271 family)